MSKFVLTAQLQLQAPNNVGAVVQQIQNQLNGINVNLNVQGSAKAQQQLQQVTKAANVASNAAERMGSTFAISIRRFAAFSIATRAVGLFTSTLSDAIQTAIDFERELIKVSQVTGKSMSELRGLTDEISRLSTSLGVSSNSLLEVSTILAQAGLSANDTTTALNTLAKAALAPNFDSITETAEGAIAILAQFKQGVGALESQLGSINAVAGAFAVEASDLIDVIRRTGGVFKSSGGDLNELLALFTSVRATTRESAESIGTGLRTIFTRIQRPKTIEFLKQFGVELVDLNGKFVGPYEAIRRLSDALSGLGEGDIGFIRIAEELGGFRQIGKVLPLLQQFATAEAALNVATTANNSLSKDAASAQATLAIRIMKVKEEFLSLVRGMTESASFQLMANTALNLASALIKLADSLKPILPLLTAVAAVKIASGLGSFIGGFGKGATSNRTFNQGGKVSKFATGGLVPGSGNSDTVPAMLTPGEFVIRKSSVAKLGAENLAHMNSGGAVQKFSTGGRSSIPRSGTPSKKYIASLTEEDLSGLKSNTSLSRAGVSRIDAELARRKKGFEDNAALTKAPKFGLVGLFGNNYGPVLGTTPKTKQQVSIQGARLNSKESKKYEGIMKSGFIDTIKTIASKLSIGVGAKPKLEQGFINDVIKKSGFYNAAGAYLESSLALVGAPFEKDSINSPIDFPSGLGSFAGKFGILSNIPTDVTRTIGSAGKSNSKFLQQIDRYLIKTGLAKQPVKKYFGGIIQKFAVGGGAGKTSVIKKGIEAGGVGIFDSDKIAGGTNVKKALLEQIKASKKPYQVISGPAGAGKTTLAASRFGNNFILSPTDIAKYSRFVVVSGAGKTKSGDFSEDAQSLFSGAEKITVLAPDKDRLMQQRQSRVESAMSGSLNDERSVGALQGTLKAPTDVNQELYAKYKNVEVLSKYAKGGNVGTDTVPALLTPGEFVVNKASAQRIGYGNLNRMNKVGKYANGGVVGVQRFAKGGDVIAQQATGLSPLTFKILNNPLNRLVGNILMASGVLRDASQDLSYISSYAPPLAKALEANAAANKRSSFTQADVIISYAASYEDLINKVKKNAISQVDAENTVRSWISTLEQDTKAKAKSATASSSAAKAKSVTTSSSVAASSPAVASGNDINAKMNSIKENIIKVYKQQYDYEAKKLAETLTSAGLSADIVTQQALLKDQLKQQFINTAKQAQATLKQNPSLSAANIDPRTGMAMKAGPGLTPQQQASKTEAARAKREELIKAGFGKGGAGRAAILLDKGIETDSQKQGRLQKTRTLANQELDRRKAMGFDVSSTQARDAAYAKAEQAVKSQTQNQASVAKQQLATAVSTRPINIPAGTGKLSLGSGGGGSGGGGSGGGAGPSKQSTDKATQSMMSLGMGIAVVTSSMQALLPPLDENSSAQTRASHALLGMVTTLGGVIFALESFGVSLKSKAVMDFLGGGGIGKKSMAGMRSGLMDMGLSKKMSTNIVGVTNGLSKFAGPLLAVAGSAYVVSTIFNTLVSSMYDYDNQLKKAIDKGDTGKARDVAGKKFELDAANTTRTVGAGAGAAIGFVLGGPIGAAIGAGLGSGIATMFANADPEMAQAIHEMFGGNTKASAIALAEAQAQAVKTAKSLDEANTALEKSMKDVEAGTMSAVEAMKKVGALTAENKTLETKNEAAISTNLQNKGEEGFSARNVGAYLGGGLFGMETSSTRNKRIDTENAKLLEGQKESNQKTYDINKRATTQFSRGSILSGIAAGKSTEEIKSSAMAQAGAAGLDTPESLRAKQSEYLSKAAAAGARGDTESADAYKALADQARKNSDDLSNAMDNMIKEMERVEKSLKALNLGLRGPAATASAASSQLQYFAAQLEGTALPAVNALQLLETSFTEAGSVMNADSIKSATSDVANTLESLGASSSSIDKFKATSSALVNAQTKYADVAAEIAAEQAASGKTASPQEVLDKFADKLGAGAPEGFKDIIKGIKIDDELAKEIERGDYSGISKKLGEEGKKFLEPLGKIIQDYQNAQNVLIDLTKKEVEARRNFVQALQEAEDLKMEGRDVQAKYGGAPVTVAEKQQSLLNKANAGNQLTGLSALRTGDVGELRQRNQEILLRYASNKQTIESNKGAGTGGTDGRESLKQQQQDLQNAQKQQVQTIREMIKLEEENLKLIGEKNKMEKDSIDALVSGDIMKFFDQQAAVGAQAAVATGNQQLANQFGTSALGAAAIETKRQQEAGVQELYGRKLAGPGGLTEAAYGSALSSTGIQNPLAMAQMAAGTTPEEEASKARLRELGGALGEAGQGMADLANMEVATASMNVQQANINLQEIIDKGKAQAEKNEQGLGAAATPPAVNKALGGLIYANRGIFVPRGTDTIPAMLTPGEFVVNRAAVQRGNNLQILQAMNSGSATNQIGDIATMARGGVVRYREGGSKNPEVAGGSGFGLNPEVMNRFATALSNFNKDLSENITNLANTKFDIQLAPTNINVNLTGTSFLETLKGNIVSEIFKLVSTQLFGKASVGSDGNIKENNSVLPPVR